MASGMPVTFLDGEKILLAGFLLGTRETLLETKDGGRTWKQRSIEAAKDEGEELLSQRHERVACSCAHH